MRTLVVIALLVAAPAVAQNRSAAVDGIFRWVTPGTPGCAVAASLNGTLVVNRAYGLADLERTVPLTTDSLFDAASIRKQVVAAADLKAYDGHYASAELRAFFDIAPGKTGLMVRLNDPPGAGVEFTPVDRDTFQRGMITFRFRRNQAGAITSLDMNNPGLRRVTFTRAQ